MSRLSVLIPARNEEWLARTVMDALANAARPDTEIVVIIDGSHKGEWPPDDPRVRLIELRDSIGQRAATNLAARESAGAHLMKLDAHCALAPGYDTACLDALAGHPDWTLVPTQRNLHVFNWRCLNCGHTTYMGPSLERCEQCGHSEHTRDLVWQPRGGTRTDFWRFDHELHFQYAGGWAGKRVETGELADTMSLLGACWVIERARYLETYGGLDEAHGSWGQMGTEIACKTWLSGGRLVTHRGTWFAHMFRTRADFSFPYPMQYSAQEQARAYSRDLWLNDKWPGQVLPLAWLVNKFKRLPGWHDTPEGAQVLQAVRQSEKRFYASHTRLDKQALYA